MGNDMGKEDVRAPQNIRRDAWEGSLGEKDAHVHKEEIKGECLGKKDLHVLLLSDSEISVNKIKQHLLATMGYSTCVWHCSCLPESIDAIKAACPEIDVVLVDFRMLSTGLPRETFRRMGDVIAGIPIIVYHGTPEQDLTLFLMEEETADSLMKDRVADDPSRLGRVIEHSMASNKLSGKDRKKYEKEISKIRDQWQVDLAAANSDVTIALKKAEEKIMKKLKEKDQIISWMSGGYSKEQ